MTEVSGWTAAPTRSRQAWSLLRDWIQRFGEDALQREVLRPAHDVAVGLLKDRPEAWDLTLEAFEELLASLGQDVVPLLVGSSRPEHCRDLAALVAAAEVDGHPLLLVYLRRRLQRDVRALVLRRRYGRRPTYLSADRGESRLAAEAVPFDRDPVGEAERHEAVVAVRQVLGTMTGKLREAQELAMDGLSQRQIARRLHLSRGAVRWRLEQAGMILHEKLAAAYGVG